MSLLQITPRLQSAVITSNTKITQKVYVARLDMPSGFEYQAGQYGSFFIDKKIRRNFSFATAPGHHFIEICADITPMGPGSRWLLSLKPEDNIQFLGPLGRFVVDYERLNERVFVATGTGIAPIRAMIEESLERQPKTTAALFWGLRHEEDVFWDKELLALGRKYPSFHYVLTLSKPSDSWEREKGRVTHHVLVLDRLQKADFYLCGSRHMVNEMTSLLLNAHVPEAQIKSELFY